MSSTYSFLPWVRQGAVAGVQTIDPLNDSLSARTTFPVRLRLDATPDPVQVQLRLHGPADVIGIDQRQIVRTEPSAGASDFPPSYFTAVEFDSPDFPWLFTPARAETQNGRLRPWLTLIVVRKQNGVTLGNLGGPLPVLQIGSPAIASDELPDLAEAWAWAHAQVLHDGNLDGVLSGEPTRTVSRLLAARRLEAHTHYFACIVPAFDVGRKAGLGLPVSAEDETALRPAWASGVNAPSSIQLPVYHHWSFSTGAAGDFEAAVRKLQPLRELPENVGGSRLHIGNSGHSSLPDLNTVDFAGVFRPPEFEPPILPPANQVPPAHNTWMQQVTAWINLADDTSSGVTEQALVTVPLYGRFHQALLRMPTTAGWVRDLNLEPRNRAAAGLGTLFVQWHQEELMASAWEQLGDLEQVRSLARQSEFAVEVGNATFARRIEPMAGRGEMLYQATAPVHQQVAAPSGQSIAAWASPQGRPRAATLATFRRFARAGGPVAKRLRGTAARLAAPISAQLAQTGAADPTPLQTYLSPVAAHIVALGKRRDTWNSTATDREAAARAAVALNALTAELQRMSNAATAGSPTLLPFTMPMQQSLMNDLRPGATVPSQLRSRLLLSSAVSGPLGTALAAAAAGDAQGSDIVAYPEFPQPMYEAVAEILPDLILTGAHELPENTVSVMETNPQFIEAFMVGLNHEMARELLWRGFPTDLRGSYFRHFWGDSAEANLERTPDINDLHEWPAANRLGGNLTDGHVEGQLVLIFKGDLLRRFPNTVIYAVQATTSGALGTVQKPPLHRGRAGDGAVFLIFDLTARQAKGGPAPAGDGGPGWYFVLQEQPTEPRFGLDATATVTVPDSFADLAWDHVETNTGGYLQIAASAAALSQINEPAGPGWGFNGAHMADIALQRPFRVAIRASQLL